LGGANWIVSREDFGRKIPQLYNFHGAFEQMDSLGMGSYSRVWLDISFSHKKMARFIFKCDEDALKIIKGNWFLDRAYLSIKHWHPCFDANEEFSASTLI